MSQVFFLAILLLAFIMFALTRLVGLRIRFEEILKTLANVLVMLPTLLIPAVAVALIGFAWCMAILWMLQGVGLLPHIPDQYVRFSLWALIAVAFRWAGFNWVRIIVLGCASFFARSAQQRRSVGHD